MYATPSSAAAWPHLAAIKNRELADPCQHLLSLPAQILRIQRNPKAPVKRIPQIEGCNSKKETINALVDAAIVIEAEVDKEDKSTEKTTLFQPLCSTSIEEIGFTLRRFKNKKAPGPDKKADVPQTRRRSFPHQIQSDS
ncbi:hypothetical protein EVAR_83773_1 [Eumeta japonica]|uniref:Uncharacterized protein n=1 Tax=Eumeta variegata TaxID=151549 RepID=A0A4C1WI87_EUMVA|nr:hypothetical protein EVAR_83773_1 [Eumeta japonica]